MEYCKKDKKVQKSNENKLIAEKILYGDIKHKVCIEQIIKSPIIDYLNRNNLSQKEFAIKCKIPLTELRQILDNSISIDTIFKIEKFLGLKKYSLISPSRSKNIITFD